MKKFDVGFVCGFVGKFVEKLVIGESVDFSHDFCIYIGRKCFGLWVWIEVCGMDESIDFSRVLRY